MTRNTEKRVEIACPILEEDIKERINEMIDIELKDNVKARELKSDGSYVNKKTNTESINSQQFFMMESIEREKLRFVAADKNN